MYKLARKIIPGSIQKRLKSHSGKKIFHNIIWLYGDKIFRLGGGLLVGIMIARYLGPANYGLYNFAFSFVWIFENVVTLGMNEVLMRELVFHPGNRDRLLGTSFSLRSGGAVIALFIIIVGIFSIRHESDVRLIVCIMAIGMMIKNAGVIKFFFEARTQSKYAVIAENISYVIFCFIKVGLILAKLPLLFFVVAYSAEALLSSVFYVYYYQKKENAILNWRLNVELGKKLIKDSWLLILTGLCIMTYVRIDQVLLAQMDSDKAAGIYSAAVRISELWVFIPSTILVSFFPSITAVRYVNRDIYMLRIQQLLDIATTISVVIAAPVALLAPVVISLLYGQAFEEAGLVLAVHIWSVIFLVLLVASARYYIIENLQKQLFIRSFFGAVLNVVLNILFIPYYGPLGAAIATLLSYAVTAFVSIIGRKTRPVTLMMLQSFNFYRIYKQYKPGKV